MAAVLQLLQDFDAWQNAFRGDDLVQYMRDHTEIPVVCVTAYLGLVFYGRDWMRDRPALNLKPLFTLWNFILATFSITGCVYTAPLLIETLSTKGFYFTVCSEPREWYFNGTSGLWTALFILSKIPEFIDTVFLVFQKKPVIFLHWYHHTTVMLYCWHAYIHTVGPGAWFAAMNYFVHAIMYSYYFLMNLSNITRKLVKPIAKTITTLQLLQMVVGMGVTVAAWWYLDNGPQGCFQDRSNNRMGLIMYTSYFVLFAHLFKKLYLTKKPANAGGKKAAKGEEDSICSATSDTCSAAMDSYRGSDAPANKPKRS